MTFRLIFDIEYCKFFLVYWPNASAQFCLKGIFISNKNKNSPTLPTQCIHPIIAIFLFVLSKDQRISWATGYLGGLALDSFFLIFLDDS